MSRFTVKVKVPENYRSLPREELEKLVRDLLRVNRARKSSLRARPEAARRTARRE